MSDELKQKLHDFLYKQAEFYYFEGSDPEEFEKECPKLIEQIEQAFKDTGYRYIPPTGDEKAKALFKIGKNLMYSWGLMSGQEWYDRFWKAIEELKENYPTLETDMYDSDHIIYAARHAAGIGEDGL